MTFRPVTGTTRAQPTMEGAGVHLHRVFGFGDTDRTDPFLLLDDFRNDDPALYSKGFPWHPHRGIETITYVLEGTVEHSDSLGNSGRLGAGSVQWMTAGSGILHQEMPFGNARGQMHGFQLWANLPSALKMTAPRYQPIVAAETPMVPLRAVAAGEACAADEEVGKVRLISGAPDGAVEPAEMRTARCGPTSLSASPSSAATAARLDADDMSATSVEQPGPMAATCVGCARAMATNL